MTFLDDALGHLNEEDSVELIKIDFELSDVLFSWEDCGVDLDEVDYLLFISHLRMAYINGYNQGAKQK